MAEPQTIAGPFPARTNVAAGRAPRSDRHRRKVPDYTLEEMMPLGELQDKVSDDLRDVLKWQFREQGWYIPLDMLLRHPSVPTTPDLAPDVAVFVGVVRPDAPAEPLTSWKINPPSFPPPTVVFEIASNHPWRYDLHLKAPIYAKMGVSEYYAFDPRPTAMRPREEREKPPLRGWSCAEGVAHEMQADQQGRMWSPALESFIVADQNYLRLRDASGARRLTGEEAERAAKERALAGEEAERAAKERLAAKLRELGVDLESLL